VPELLAKASILVLPRAWGTFSQAGFPTKLGEYLATGRPVVVTATGDIPDYLTDRHSAFLVYTDGIAAFAQQLGHVMRNMAAAQVVGQRGRKVAEEEFDVNRHSRRMLDWFGKIDAVRNQSKHLN
jgi:glycosyltransferase involved in cell wall biosynthesis